MRRGTTNRPSVACSMPTRRDTFEQ
jgi:hypothetical protein